MTPPSEPLYPVVQGMKICSRLDCKLSGQPQSIERFEKASRVKSGHVSHCKSCANMYKKRWKLENPRPSDPVLVREKAKRRRQSESYRIWYANNRVALNKYGKEWRAANSVEVKRRYILRRFRQYGVTPDWYEKTLASQDGKCAICGTCDPKSNENKTFHVDHDHSCCTKPCNACDKCRRGLLCSVCNTWLGILESKEWVSRARKYLARYK